MLLQRILENSVALQTLIKLLGGKPLQRSQIWQVLPPVRTLRCPPYLTLHPSCVEVEDTLIILSDTFTLAAIIRFQL